MIATLATPSPLDQWRQRLGGKRRLYARPRPWAALGYLANGPVIEGLIEIQRLILVVLYDEPCGHGRHALRLAGYSGKRVCGGVQWGGPEQCRFFKDLLLQPVPKGRGSRLDVGSGDLLCLGLALDRMVECHARHRFIAQRQIRLPRLWAGFRPGDVASITGDGPELLAASQQAQAEPAELFTKSRRDHWGLAVYPLAWVSHHAQQAVSVFADLATFAKRRAFRLDSPADDLTGFQDAAEFDLFHSRFRPGTKQRPHSRREPALAPA